MENMSQPDWKRKDRQQTTQLNIDIMELPSWIVRQEAKKRDQQQPKQNNDMKQIDDPAQNQYVQNKFKPPQQAQAQLTTIIHPCQLSSPSQKTVQHPSFEHGRQFPQKEPLIKESNPLYVWTEFLNNQQYQPPLVQQIPQQVTLQSQHQQQQLLYSQQFSPQQFGQQQLNQQNGNQMTQMCQQNLPLQFLQMNPQQPSIQLQMQQQFQQMHLPPQPLQQEQIYPLQPIYQQHNQQQAIQQFFLYQNQYPNINQQLQQYPQQSQLQQKYLQLQQLLPLQPTQYPQEQQQPLQQPQLPNQTLPQPQFQTPAYQQKPPMQITPQQNSVAQRVYSTKFFPSCHFLHDKDVLLDDKCTMQHLKLSCGHVVCLECIQSYMEKKVPPSQVDQFKTEPPKFTIRCPFFSQAIQESEDGFTFYLYIDPVTVRCEANLSKEDINKLQQLDIFNHIVGNFKE